MNKLTAVIFNKKEESQEIKTYVKTNEIQYIISKQNSAIDRLCQNIF